MKIQKFLEKMKFKTRLVAGNSIWPAKIRPEGPLSLLKLSCKIFWYHLKNSWKKFKKTYPPPKKRAFLGGGGSGDSCHLCTMCLGLLNNSLFVITIKHFDNHHPITMVDDVILIWSLTNYAECWCGHLCRFVNQKWHSIKLTCVCISRSYAT